MTYYVGPHLQQYDFSAYTASYGCTWTSGATGVATTTGGRHKPSPDYIHSLLPRTQETNPATPGWSIYDLKVALSRYGMSFTDRTGKGWSDLIAQLDEGHYCVVQGDSDQFGNGTCSGAFDGNHAIGVSPRRRVYNGYHQRWIDDPICAGGRWEYEFVIRRYATKLWSSVMYGSFTARVPTTDAAAPTPSTGGTTNVAIRYATVTDTASRMTLADGQRLYDHPGGSVVTRMSRAASVPHVGLAGSVNGKAWRAVVVGTAHGYSDGKPHKTVLYVPSSAGKVVAG